MGDSVQEREFLSRHTHPSRTSAQWLLDLVTTSSLQVLVHGFDHLKHVQFLAPKIGCNFHRIWRLFFGFWSLFFDLSSMIVEDYIRPAVIATGLLEERHGKCYYLGE